MTDIAGNATTTAVLETNLGGSTGTLSGQLETFEDHDWIRVSLTAGVDYSFSLALQIVGAPDGDSQLRLHDASGAMVAENDDNSASLNSFLSFNPTVSGTYYLDVFSHTSGERGSYSVLMTDLDADAVFFSGSNDNYSAHARERVVAGAGDDRIDLDTSGFDAFGEQGNDNLIGNDQENVLSGGLGNDAVFGGAGDDAIFGDAGDDFLIGSDDDDQLFGGDGLDELDGGEGRDLLAGGAGTDTLAGGGGQDAFIFKTITDSVKGSGRDQIFDFNHDVDHDKIDVSAIDADLHKHGNQAFHFIGAHGFGHHDGELRYAHHILQGDVNGDGRADFEIQVNADHLVKGDFVL
jgi:Ca2+-binding RTX toxin-like protein